MAWQRDEWNRPDRTDHYLMQVAAEVLRQRVKDPSKIKTDEMRLVFGTEPPRPDVEAEKSAWVAAAGGKDRVRRVTLPRPPDRTPDLPPSPTEPVNPRPADL